jgi:hypothetical protein
MAVFFSLSYKSASLDLSLLVPILYEEHSLRQLQWLENDFLMIFFVSYRPLCVHTDHAHAYLREGIHCKFKMHSHTRVHRVILT